MASQNEFTGVKTSIKRAKSMESIKSGQTNNMLAAFAALDRLTKSAAAADKIPRWERDFGSWIWECCRFRDDMSSNLSVLYQDFCGWNIRRDCERQMFANLVAEAGFRIEVHGEAAMAYGLVLAEDLPAELAERLRPRALDENGCLVIEIDESRKR